MNMAGRVPGNIQQPMASFEYGNNMNFYEANMGNSMGYDQGNGTENSFWQLTGQFWVEHHKILGTILQTTQNAWPPQPFPPNSYHAAMQTVIPTQDICHIERDICNTASWNNKKYT